MKNKVLVVVDMQKDFIDGALGGTQQQMILENVKQKVLDAITDGTKVFFTRDTHFSDYLSTQEGKNLPVEHCIRGSEGWKVHETLRPLADKSTYLDKNTFASTELITELADFESLKGSLDEVELVGVCTGICVISNALLIKAYFTETVVTVDGNCCACVTPDTHKTALEAMKVCQVNVIGG